MIKVFDPNGWSWERPIAHLIKVSSRGLVGADRSEFIKLAGDTAPAFVGLIDHVKFAKDEVPVHLIALGATEHWGSNRNGDGWKEATAKDRHHTFVSHARPFRNHNNKPKNGKEPPAYGVVKASAYNNAMHRVELLLGLNASKEAAERNHGFIADSELAKLEKDGSYAVSMACGLPWDECASCHHRARKPEEYCLGVHEGGQCKYGGCRHNLTKVADDGFVLHVDNPNCTFFDISHVFRPADRTAYAAPADWLQKAASHEFVPGAVLARELGLTLPSHLIGDPTMPLHQQAQVKLAMALAAVEQQAVDPSLARAADPAYQPALSDQDWMALGQPGTHKAASALHALNSLKVLLNLDDFARWTGRSEAVKTAAQLLPGIYTQLVGSDRIEALVAKSPWYTTADCPTPMQRKLAHDLAASRSLHTLAVQDRAMLHSLRQAEAPNLKTTFWNEKLAADQTAGAVLAEDYAAYQLAALTQMAAFDSDFKLTARLAVAQNKL